MENILENKPATRPTFLSVLCVLTWIGCAFSFYGGINSVFGPTPRENLVKMASQADKVDGQAKEMMESSIEFMSANLTLMEKWNFPNGLITILCAGLCLFGSISMWKLRKSGFLFYVVGQVIPIILGVLMYFEMTIPSSGMMATMTKAFSIGTPILAILFIGLYSMNLKHLK